uniref:Uncharacterized protein n=1 Tax=Oryza glumipatula TaxID=40148 RepID=A0A0D9Z7U1_9ORYZ
MDYAAATAEALPDDVVVDEIHRAPPSASNGSATKARRSSRLPHAPRPAAVSFVSLRSRSMISVVGFWDGVGLVTASRGRLRHGTGGVPADGDP